MSSERDTTPHSSPKTDAPQTQSLHESELRAQTEIRGQLQSGVRKKFGPYELVREIGRGGMGTVWLATQEQPIKRTVALKVIRPEFAVGEMLVRFESERQALAMMNHPNVAQILDAGATPDGQPYFAMEYVDGKPLNEYCDEHRLNVLERLQLFLDVCAGVQHAHQKGIIHRDLKPNNILVAMEQGTAVVKVIDFGLSKVIQGNDRLTEQSLFTQIGQVLGTYQYMSPEQANLSELDIDTRTDVYALGVILYELLTGCTPLESSTLKGMIGIDILRMIRDYEPMKPSSRLSTASTSDASSVTSLRQTDSRRLKQILLGDLDWVAMHALEKDRARRYPSVTSFADDVQRYINNEPVTARPPSVAYRLRKYARKHRAAVISGIAVSATIIFSLIGLTIAYIEALRQRTKAEDNLLLARQGFDIMGSVFANLDPRGQYNTVADLRSALSGNLSAAMTKLDSIAKADPLEAANMQNSLGLSFSRLEKHQSAVELLVKAMEIRQNLLGFDHPETLASQNNLASCYRAMGDYDKALKLSQLTYDTLLDKLGKSSPQTLNALNNLGNGLRAAGRMDEAIITWRELLDTAKDELDKSDPNVLMAMNNLGNAYMATGNHVEGFAILEELVLRLGDSTQADALNVKQNLASAYIHLRQPERAIPILEKLLEQRKGQFDENSSEVLINKFNLAEAYNGSGKTGEAMPYYEASIAGMRKSWPKDHPLKLECMIGLAGCYQANGQPQTAFDVFAEMLELTLNRQDSVPESLSGKVPLVLNTLIDLSELLGKSEENEKYHQLREVLSGASSRVASPSER